MNSQVSFKIAEKKQTKKENQMKEARTLKVKCDREVKVEN